MKRLLTIFALMLVAFTANAQSCPDNHHPHMIDLGLPSGTKWACCNVDDDPSKQSPTNFGGYYAWGEMNGNKEVYDENSYMYYQNGSYVDIGNDISGTEYDVAHVKWGGTWRLPSNSEIEELVSNCRSEWITLNGVAGCKFTSEHNNSSIFLPAAGHRYGLNLSTPSDGGSLGDYWSSTLGFYSDRSWAYDLDLYTYCVEVMGWGGRTQGESVRPVCTSPVSTIIGDVNGDGEVSITDVALTVNHILGTSSSSINVANADVNGDGDVNVTDVMGIVGIILGEAGVTNGKVLQIWLIDGNVVNINLDDQPVTTYADGVLTITTTKTTISYPLEEVSKYTYVSSKSIESYESMAKPLQGGETLACSWATKGNENDVQASSGQLMRKAKTKTKSQAMKTVSDLPPMKSQDFMNIYFKNGSSIKYYMDKLIEFATLKVNNDGMPISDYRNLNIITEISDYYFDLFDIDSIRFTKISEEQLNQNYQDALEVVLPALSECTTAADAESQLGIIKNSESVEDAWCDETNCFIKIKDGETISFHFNHVANEDETDMARSIEQVRNCLKGIKNSILLNGETIKVAIVNQQYKDESRTEQKTNYFDPLETEFKSFGIQVDRIDSLTIDFFYKPNDSSKHKNIYDYDMTFLITHGDYNMDLLTHNILLSTELGIERKRFIWSDTSSALEDVCCKNLEVYRDTVLNGLISDMNCVTVGFNEEERDGKKYWVGYVNLSENFFSSGKNVGKFVNPKSILFNGACQTLKDGESFAKTLVEKQKLGVYLGYDETTYLSEQTGFEWFHGLLSGKSAYKAYEDLPEKHRIESFDWDHYIVSLNYHAQLLFRTQNNDYFEIFLFPTITEAIDQTEVQTCFDEKGYVEVKGYATSIDPQSIFMGFLYGTDDKNLSSNQDASFSGYIENQGKGNCKFVAKLKDLEANKNYYYRAYTYDSKYYNYGNLESFTTYEKLTLSTNSITVSALTSSSVQITSGSGNYEIESVVPSGVVTASIVDNSIVAIEALTAGPAMITVKDTKSGQTATIEVTVTQGTNPVSYLTCPDDHHPHLIDLGLPSGTKWACCNVGADKPEGYGGYYAWGETEEKDYYDWSTYIHCDGSENTCHDLGSDIAGTQFDVAHYRWGGSWVMPSYDQQVELIKNCTYEWTTLNGVNGGKFTSKKNGGTIFLPAAGHRWRDSLRLAGSHGYYWSSTQRPSNSYYAYNPYYAYNLYFNSGGAYWSYGGDSRNVGRPVRPVSR